MKKDERFLLVLDQEMKDKLKVAADTEGCSMNEFVRRLIDRVPVIGYIKDGKIEFVGKERI